ncbi:tetratricopeptide repeat protein [Streptomyces sp. AM8-1-1]|uniref:tetratricopeptide repeat protein n=1 Tax=Streptomyces sp. AM8-1-1 TaxID=3075825 RepID=UPI0028C3BAB6|nr:tetratricopeptide repeat protein [Streptomyces sp. AM8-1-1]WNO73998.1 tetratricopeptide repeat protein [Streptomyces sp. AM8-1-1]
MAGSRPSMQQILKSRQHFVGRREELARFRGNFDIPPEDERHCFIFHVHGSAGVGKSALVRRLEDAARERGALTAYVDESVNSVPEAMTALCGHFERQGHPLKALDRMLATYRQRRYEAEALAPEPAGPEGPGATGPGREAQEPNGASVAVTRAGLAGLGLLPGVGPFTAMVDPAQLAQGTEKLRAALAARFRNHDDVQLVLDPLRTLTPVLAAELERVAERAPWIALFFDTYERTGPFLDDWLRDLLTTERYGALPANIVVTTAGQRPLDPVRWGDCVGLVTELPLRPFTDAEARQLLAAKGVLDETVVRDVLHLSGRLPVLVSTLAENPGDVGDPSATAVERFLKWETEPVRRAAALEGALPRHLDEDLFHAVAGDGAGREEGLYGWLRSLPFVSEHGGRARYHDVVRAPMLRLRRTGSPQRWSESHGRLAAVYAARCAEAGGTAPLWADESWRAARVEEVYHLLCARPRTALPAVLQDGVAACGEGIAVARGWARAVAEAGEDGGAQELGSWGRECLAALEDERLGAVRVLGLLIGRSDADDGVRALAYAARGRQFFRLDAYEEALADYGQGIALAPDDPSVYRGRAVVHRAAGGFDEALEDLDKAEELLPGSPETVRERGETYRRAGRLAEADAELGRALALEPGDWLAHGSRGQTRYQQGRLREALTDLDRAVELGDAYVWALVRRAHVRLRLHDFEGALEDLDRADRLAPDTAATVGERGEVYRFMGRNEEAVEQFDRALALNPVYTWALGSRAMAYAALGRPERALADLERALALDPDYAWALTQRDRLRDGAAPG